MTAKGTRNEMEVIVSTDSKTIRNISTNLGARVMRYRPDELATDDADAHEVWQSEVKYAERLEVVDMI